MSKQQHPVSCPNCNSISILPWEEIGREIICLQCNFHYLSRPFWTKDEFQRKQEIIEKGEVYHKDKADFRGKLLYHKPLQDNPTPSDENIIHSNPRTVEISYDVQNDREVKSDLHVCLDDIRSQWNVGSIFRTTDASSWSSVTLTGITSTPNSSPIVKKTALGAEEWINWLYYANIIDAVNYHSQIKEREIVALELTKESESIFDFVPNKKMTLILGNEVSGISPEALNMCNRRVMIPMAGRKGSLNVAVAFGIASFLIAKKWKSLYS